MRIDHRSWLWIVLLAGLLGAPAGSALAQGCRPHSHVDPRLSSPPHYVCSCDGGYEPHPDGCRPIPTGNPITACLASGQLKAVDARIAKLKKVIAVVGDPSRFETDRERVLDDMREDGKDLSFEAVNLMSIGFARILKEGARFNVLRQQANAGKVASQLGQLADEEWRMSQALSQTKDLELAQRILEYKGALNQVRVAEQGGRDLETANRMKEAAFKLRDNYELMKLKPPSQSVANALYTSSALLGSGAMVFVEGPGAIAAAAGSAGASIAIGGRAAMNVWEEAGRLKAVYEQRADRDELKNELLARLGKLQQQRAQLAEVLRQAGPPDCAGIV